MSFSADVKEELEKHINTARHCGIAEMAAYIINLSNAYNRKISDSLVFLSENEKLLNKVCILFKKTYNTNVMPKKLKGNVYCISIDDLELVNNILQSVRFEPNPGRICSELLLKNSCCKRAYLQGTFTCIGSMTSPDKGYHLEFVSNYSNQLEQIKFLISGFDIESKITGRKKSFVLYVKEGAAIVDLLNIMGAHVSLMNMENAIILKDMRNDLNRKVNCEAANIIKSINAASRQLDDINYLKEHGGFASLPDALKEMAEVRIAHPDTALKDLGVLLNPTVGKSGVNHRLRRLSELANELREKENKCNNNS